MMRRLRDRLRTSRATALYHRLDGTSEDDGRPWMISGDERGVGVEPARRDNAPEPHVDVVGAIVDDEVDDAIDEVIDVAAETGVVNDTRSDIDTTPAATTPAATAPEATAAAAIDPGLVPALNRVADAFERMAQTMEVEHREREARLGAVEELLRELVTGLAHPTAVPPVVVGGSIDLERLHEHPDTGPEIDLVDPHLELTASGDPPGAAAKSRAPVRRTKRT
jgi:hypothetical protein